MVGAIEQGNSEQGQKDWEQDGNRKGARPSAWFRGGERRGGGDKVTEEAG